MKLNNFLILLITFLLIGCFTISTEVFATYTSPYPEPTVLLKKGSSSAGVKWVQDMLNHNGYKLTIDGIFGNDTYSAVTKFQSKYNLTVDGIVGKYTRIALKNNSISNNALSNNSMAYTTANLNLRKGASTSYSIITTIPKNSAITIVSNNSNGWSLIKYNSTYGFVSSNFLSKTKPDSTNLLQNTNASSLPVFVRNSSNLIDIIKNCKSYYATNKFYYSTANGVRSIPADKSIKYGDYNRYYTDCSCYVSWVLYEYALACNQTDMQKYFSYQRNSTTFKSIGDNGGNNYLSVISKKTSSSNVDLSKAKPGDILVSPGHVEFFNSYTTNSNGTISLKVYNCGSTSSIQVDGLTYSATKDIGDITYILRIK